MVSMASYYETLKGVRTKILISQQQLILEYLTWYHINSSAYQFYLMDGYTNYLICIFINIKENFRNERNILRRIKGCTYKITNGLPAMCSSVSNLMPNQCLNIVLLP